MVELGSDTVGPIVGLTWDHSNNGEGVPDQHSSSNVSEIDRPSSSRSRPTASNRRRRQRIEEVIEEVQEPDYELDQGYEEE